MPSSSRAEQCTNPLSADEVALFYPTSGRLLEPHETDLDASFWEILIHAHVYEPETALLLRRVLVKGLSKIFKIDEKEFTGRFFEERSRAFLVDNQRGKNLSVEMLGKVWTLTKTKANGHSQTVIRIPENEVGLNMNHIAFQLVDKNGTSCDNGGTVLLHRPKGLIVVSDIDDTIKISNVLDKQELIRNSLIREFKPVPGMAAVYERWQKTFSEMNVGFHYLSASPWQLFPALAAFIEKHSFPKGTVDLKLVRLWDQNVKGLFVSAEKYKPEKLRPLFARFPERRFVLVGDSGEKDPEIYGTIAREFPRQIAAIYIREVHTKIDLPRYQKAFRTLHPKSWQIFSDPREIDDTRIRLNSF